MGKWGWQWVAGGANLASVVVSPAKKGQVPRRVAEGRATGRELRADGKDINPEKALLAWISMKVPQACPVRNSNSHSGSGSNSCVAAFSAFIVRLKTHTGSTARPSVRLFGLS
uniref:HDC08154 n=1 Tax=Drosophila melanogaster TaxID=7227 RepID=Q6ILX6_DROME|nr:TPA_inf: HDC08154 [Drosophila melanogaster]